MNLYKKHNSSSEDRYKFGEVRWVYNTGRLFVQKETEYNLFETNIFNINSSAQWKIINDLTGVHKGTSCDIVVAYSAMTLSL